MNGVLAIYTEKTLGSIKEAEQALTDEEFLKFCERVESLVETRRISLETEIKERRERNG